MTSQVTHTFILCAGSGERWEEYLGVPKQLMSFGGTTLLERTTRLVEGASRGQMYCVTWNPRILAPKHSTLRIPPTQSLAETILATAGYWGARNVMLLGDVFYSQHAITQIYSARRPLVFFGRPWPSDRVHCGHGELFGVSFTGAAEFEISKLLRVGLATTRRGAVGNLWNLYQIASGRPLGASCFVPRLLVPIDDYTNDIDTQSDYCRRAAVYQRIASTEVEAHTQTGPNRSSLFDVQSPPIVESRCDG